MSTSHGNKRYLQLLIDPNRAAVLEEMAARDGVRVTALARDLIYGELKRQHPGLYEAAAEDDARAWKKSVANRVAARQRNRQLRKAAEA